MAPGTDERRAFATTTRRGLSRRQRTPEELFVPEAREAFTT
jgi:hypothetical protein